MMGLRECKDLRGLILESCVGRQMHVANVSAV